MLFLQVLYIQHQQFSKLFFKPFQAISRKFSTQDHITLENINTHLSVWSIACSQAVKENNVLLQRTVPFESCSVLPYITYKTDLFNSGLCLRQQYQQSPAAAMTNRVSQNIIHGFKYRYAQLFLQCVFIHSLSIYEIDKRLQQNDSQCSHNIRWNSKC